MANEIVVERIKPGDLDAATDVFVKTSKHIPFSLWVFNNEKLYNEHAFAYKSIIKYCMLYGIALKTSHCEGIILARYSSDLEFKFWRALRCGLFNHNYPQDIRLKLNLNSALFTYEANQNMGSQPFIYAMYLGVDPDCRQRGIGSMLLRKLFDLSKEKQLPIYGETSTEIPTKIYLSQGFKIISQFKFPPGTDITISAIKRLPD